MAPAPKKTPAAAASSPPPPPNEDVYMTDAAAPPHSAETVSSTTSSSGSSSPELMGEEYVSFEEGEPRIVILANSSTTAASYQFHGEDHTLGNSLRYIIMKNPDVEFCGYSIPHPSEPKMNLRIQTYAPYTAVEALQKGLEDLMDLCDVVSDKFAASRADFATNGPMPKKKTGEEVNIDDDDSE